MIRFQKIQYKNFLSSGNYWTTIKLNENDSTLIIGQNGSGKSTLLDALTFGLFNKPFRKISKSQLVNTVNEKDCVVEIEFSVNKDQYKITRGIKPNIFKIEKNNKILDELSCSTDQQKWLEQNVLKLNYKSFTQIVILGSSNFVPFMQLSSQHRREVVEDLLDIRIFSLMNEITKSNIKSFKDDIRNLEYKKENYIDKIELQENFIKKIQTEGNSKIEKLKREIDLILPQVDICVAYNKKNQDEIDVKTKELEDLSSYKNKLKKLTSIKGKLSQKVSTTTENHQFFKDNSVCPTCTQNIEERFRLNKIDEYEKLLNELNSGYGELEQAILNEENREQSFLTISKGVTDLTHEISQNNLRISGFQKRVRDLESEIQAITNNLENENIEYEKLKKQKSELNQVIEELTSKKEELLNYEFVHLLLKDGGAKSSIIKKYIPIINKNLNRYLDIMEFSINFMLDEEFNEKALNPIYEDFSYDSFSEGEKMRIDLALLFTWREVAKIKNSVNTNLLILDEVFDSSLDEFGTDNFTKIIKYVISNSNVFVISHKVDELEDKFTKVIKFQKQKGFGVMVD
jgi:DNA repair exonuclease SbcCD ATPase subunit